MNRIIVIFFSLIFITTNAQKFADKEFYLVDSLKIEDLSEFDRTLTDSLLSQFHSEKEDTIKFDILKQIIHKSTNYPYTQKLAIVLKQYAQDVILNTDSERIKYLAKYQIGVYYMNKAFAYSYLGSSNDEYMMYLDSAAMVFTDINEPTPLIAILSYKAYHFQQIGHSKKAIEYYQEAILKSEKIDYISGQIQSNYGLGTVRMELEEYETAFKNHSKSLKIAEQKGDKRYMGLNLLVLGQIYFEQNKLDSSLNSIENAISHLEEIGDANMSGQGYYYLGKIASENQEYKKAKSFFDKNIVLYTKYEDHSGMSLNYLAKAEQDFKLNDLDLAEKNALKALDLSKKNNYIKRIVECSELLSKIYQKKGNMNDAFLMHKIHSEFKDSLYNSKNKRASINQEYEYEYEKQKEVDDLKNQQQLALAAEEKKKIQIGMIAAATIAGLIALFSIFIFNRLKLIRKQKAELDNAYEQLEEAKKNELAVSNLKALQSQMNPHFIFNALNSVQDLVLLQDIRNSNKYLGKFSDLIRKILLSSKEQFISLEEEVEILSLYLDLEKLRFGEDFEIDFQCNVSEEEQEEIQLPAMFIQPYIENAIKHGLLHKAGKKELMVHFNLMPNVLECIVKDNGVGQEKAAEMKKKRLHLHTGFSTEAINERIRLLNETLDKKIELEIKDLYENKEPVGTKIILQFPLGIK